MKLLKAVILKYKLLIPILLVGLFLRTYKPLELFLYSHDQDLLSWFIKDVVVNHNLRLIGQETSVHGVFIGPLFYYAVVPFYLLWGMSPIGGIAFVTLIGIFTVFSVYYVFKSIWGNRVGLIGALIYAISFYTIFTDREVVPTTPVIVWSVWFLYCISEILKGSQKKGFLVAGILLGLIWHLNVALILLFPLVLLAQVYSKKKIQLKNLVWPAVAFLILVSPFIIFEVRHNFSEIRAVITEFKTPPAFAQTKAEKFDRVIQLFEKNLGSVWGTSLINIPRRPILYLLPVILLMLFLCKRISSKFTVLIASWIILFLVFFTFNSLNLSEYYLNGTVVVMVAIAALFIDFLLSKNIFMFLGIFILGAYVLINLKSFFEVPINKSGYVERMAIISEIKNDAKLHNYPCVSISYITSPGSNLGYRYLIYIQGLHVNLPKSLSPVYTIVFPHSMVDKIDKSFGALGLIYPDYKRYNQKDVDKSCEGEDANLTDSLFGYVQ